MGPLVASIDAAIAALPPEKIHPPAIVEPDNRDHRPIHWAFVALGAAAVADSVTTERGLRDPRFEEANPFLQGSGAKRNVVKAVGNVALAWAADRLYNRHPKVAMFMVLLGAGTQGGAAVANAHRHPE